MPKLAIPTSPTSFSHVIRTRHRLHPQSTSSSRCASSHVRPLAHTQIRHDLPLSHSSSNPLPSLSQPPFNLRYSINDDLNPKNQNDHKPPSERILKLGKTLRTLSPLLPTILINPLPPQILSPSVTLHLFPSTHPHLPTVKGRTLYRAALWAVPVAWSSVPLVGNVKLQILSERIVRAGTVPDPHLNATHSDAQSGNSDRGDERLVVRWRTEPTHSSNTPSSSSLPSGSGSASTSPKSDTSTSTSLGSDGESKTGTNKGLSVLLGGDAPIFKLSSDDHFTGLFIFSFDEEGCVLTQTIEHAEDASGWERTAKFVTLTDWLIGKARGSLDPSPPAGLVGCTEFGSNGSSTHAQDHERSRWRRHEGKGDRMSETSS
ncbi:hypothetical protein BDW62DRAFT_194515 [Aspergillus aurantiobrunneus]